MIAFNGVRLETAVPGIKIEDIRVSPIQLSPVTRDRALAAGAEYVRMKQGTRTITVSFALLEMDKDTRESMLEAVTRWARSDVPMPLTIDTREGVQIDAICTALPEPSLRQWWESRLTVAFTAYDPFFYSTTEKSVACGTEFTVNGDAPPMMRITKTRNSAASNQSYSDGVHTMTFSSIPAGDMEIDLTRQTAKVGSASIMQNYTIGSRFIIPAVGVHTITGTGTVYWRERWE